MEYQVHEAFLLVPPEAWRGFHGDTAHPEEVFLFRQTIKNENGTHLVLQKC